MPSVNCTVVSGGGWNAIGSSFPDNQNDGDNETYQGWPGDTAGTQSNLYDNSVIPDGAIIQSVGVSGLWDAGSPPATCTVRCHLGADNTLLDSALNDVSSYSYDIARPGGGSWTKADIGGMSVQWSSNQTGNGNNMRLKSSVLTVTYILSGETFVSIF